MELPFLKDNPRMKKMLLCLAVLLLVSGVWNYNHFIVKGREEKKRLEGQYERELAADPLFSDVKYNSLYGKNEKKKEGDKKSETVAVGPATSELVSQETRERVMNEVAAAENDNRRVYQVSQEKLSGVVFLTESESGVDEVEMKLQISSPRALEVEELIAGAEYIWLREIDAKLRGIDEKRSNVEAGELVFSGKAKAYVQLNTDRFRTVVDILITLTKPEGESAWKLDFRVSRGQRSAEGFPFVERQGEDFAIEITGKAIAVETSAARSVFKQEAPAATPAD